MVPVPVPVSGRAVPWAAGAGDGLRAVTASTTPARRTSTTLARMMSLRRGVPALAVAAAGSTAALLAGCLVVIVVSVRFGPGPVSALAGGHG